MWDYPSDCPEPRRAEYTDMAMIQHTGGQYVAKSQQFCDAVDTRQLGIGVSRAVYNGILGWESQQE